MYQSFDNSSVQLMNKLTGPRPPWPLDQRRVDAALRELAKPTPAWLLRLAGVPETPAQFELFPEA